MSLLVPDSGLLFWMLLSFGIVFFVLAKYGFPVIVKMVNERKEYIDRSLVVAKEANEQLANLKAEGETIMAKAHEEQARILNEAVATRDRIIKEAKEQARIEGDKMMEEVKRRFLLVLIYMDRQGYSFRFLSHGLHLPYGYDLSAYLFQMRSHFPAVEKYQ